MTMAIFFFSDWKDIYIFFSMWNKMFLENDFQVVLDAWVGHFILPGLRLESWVE
jgi:hypothetical protein